MRSGKLIVLHIVAVAVLFALWWSGIGKLVMDADRVHSVPVACGIWALALWLGIAGKWGHVKFLADMAPVIALVGTVLGALTVVPDIVSGADHNAVKVELIDALVANMLGACLYFWLSLCKHVCDPHA